MVEHFYMSVLLPDCLSCSVYAYWYWMGTHAQTPFRRFVQLPYPMATRTCCARTLYVFQLKKVSKLCNSVESSYEITRQKESTGKGSILTTCTTTSAGTRPNSRRRFPPRERNTSGLRRAFRPILRNTSVKTRQLLAFLSLLQNGIAAG